MTNMVEYYKESVRTEATRLQSFVSSGDLENSLRCIMNLTSLATVAHIYAENNPSEEAKELDDKTKSFLSGKALQMVLKKWSK